MHKENKVQKYYCSKRGVVDNDKMSIHQGHRTILKLHIIYNTASKYMKQTNKQKTKLKGKVNKTTNMEYSKCLGCSF